MGENDWVKEESEQSTEHWIIWHGQTSECPVNENCLITFKRRDGEIGSDIQASFLTWDHHDAHYDILEYCVTGWYIDPEEEFKHEGGNWQPIPDGVTVQIDQGRGYDECRHASPSDYMWGPVKSYKIIREI